MIVFDVLMTIFTGACICGVLACKQLLRSLMWLSAFGMIMTVRYLLLSAPDIAITEAALGAGLSSLVFLTAIKFTHGHAAAEKDQDKKSGDTQKDKGRDHG